MCAESAADCPNLAAISLYFPYNDPHRNTKTTLWMSSYGAGERYAMDQNASSYTVASESKNDGKQLRYKLEDDRTPYGIVATAYPMKNGIVEKLLAALKREPSWNVSQPTDMEIMGSFVKGRKRLKTTPSLVDHIGYYSEHRNEDKFLIGGKYGFVHISKDIRFQLRDGWDQ